MKHMLYRLHGVIFSWRHLAPEEFVALFLALLIFVAPVTASTRFTNRGLYMKSAEPQAITDYTISLSYMTPEAVGSVDMLYCTSPIPDEPCIPPSGLDVSQAVLANQTGETGFSILTHTPNHIVLTRPPAMIAGVGSASSYTFSNMHNPIYTAQAFSIRMTSHASNDATGPRIDFGSVTGTVTYGVVLETQVTPTLMFCLARQVSEDCTSTDDTYYSDMGDLSSSSTLTAQSQMAVGTNASAGFVITANGGPPAAGTNVIDGLTTPTESRQGTNQFGINLVANNNPIIGNDPEGTWMNAVPSADYSVPNKYKFISGEAVASSPNVSLMKKFTVSYIVNSTENLRAGVYTTTITYIASGRF